MVLLVLTHAAFNEKTLDLRNVSSELSVARYKLYQIGIQLGIPHNKLKEFEKESDPLSASIVYWLKGNVGNVPVTWQSIVDALSSPQVEEKKLSQEIAEKYCPPMEKGQGKLINNTVTNISAFSFQKVYRHRLYTVPQPRLL